MNKFNFVHGLLLWSGDLGFVTNTTLLSKIPTSYLSSSDILESFSYLQFAKYGSSFSGYFEISPI